MTRLLFLLTALFLTACAATPQGSTPAGSAPTQISFAMFGDPAERAAYDALVAAFSEAHPEIQVNLQHTPNQNDYRRQLAADYAAGAPPDVSLMNHRRIGNFAANGLMEPLGTYMENSTVFQPEDFYPITLDAFKWQGTVMCVPQNISSLVVYYNKDMFDAAGLPYPSNEWTWDDFVAYGKALTQDTDGDGFMDQYGLGTDTLFFRIVPFIAQNQGAIVDNVDYPTRLTMNRQVSMEAMQWYVDLRLVHGIVPTREEEASMDSESRFVGGVTAMYLNSRRGTPTYREITAFDWDVAPLPKGVQKAGLLHTDGYCMSASTANKEAAWTFIEFANSPEGQTLIAGSGRTVPSLIAVAESPAFLDPTTKPTNNRVFLDTIPDLVRVPTIATWEEIERVAGEELDRAFYGDISVSQAADLMFLRTEEYFRLANLVLTPTPQ
jgi:multiple sugar transport system substrate-binding protein